MKYCVYAYKPESDASCRGYVWAHYEYDLIHKNHIDENTCLELLVKILKTNDNLRTSEYGYQTAVIFQEVQSDSLQECQYVFLGDLLEVCWEDERNPNLTKLENKAKEMIEEENRLKEQERIELLKQQEEKKKQEAKERKKQREEEEKALFLRLKKKYDK